LSVLRKRAGRIAEVSSLAIRKDFQGNNGQLLLPLSKFMYTYCKQYAEVDILVMSTHEAAKEFYQAVMLCEPLDGKAKFVNNKFIKNVVPFCQFLDFSTLELRASLAFAQKKNSFNLHRYFCLEVCDSHFEFPQKKQGQCQFPVLNSELLNYFFDDKLPVLSKLDQFEKQHLCNLQMIELSDSEKLSRKEFRLPTKRKATFFDTELYCLKKATVIEVSNSGFILKIESEDQINNLITMNVDLGALGLAKLSAKPVWQDKIGRVGFQIVGEVCSKWMTFVLQLSPDNKIATEGKKYLSIA
jgi:hypothetical protein